MRTKARQTLPPPPRFSTFLTNKPRLCAAAFLLSATFFTSPAGAFPTSTDLYKITEISAETYNTATANAATDVFAFSSMDESGKAVTKYYQWLLSDNMFTPLPNAEGSVLSLKTTNADGSVAETYYGLADGFTKGYTTEEGGELQDQRLDNTIRTSKNIKGNFIGYNYFNEAETATGGGLNIELRSKSNINIQADFINNSVNGPKADTWPFINGGGGASLSAHGIGVVEIDGVKGNFIGNSVQAIHAYGGGLLLRPANINTQDSLLSVKNIAGNFISNHITGDVIAGGGALAVYSDYGEDGNQGHIKELSANFINNYAYSANGNSFGGALLNGSFSNGSFFHRYSIITYIENINGNFANNHAAGQKDTYGGAIYNAGYLRKTSGIFSNNYAYSAEGNAFGGAAASVPAFNEHLNKLIVMTNGDRQLYLFEPGSRDIDFQHILPDDRGAVVINGTVPDDEEAQVVFSLYFHLANTPVESITAEFISEITGMPAGEITPEDIEEMKMAAAMLQEMVIDPGTYDPKYKNFTEFYNASFFNNRATAAAGNAYGGAIYGTGIKIIADNYTSVFDGNTANNKNNAIYAYDVKTFAKDENNLYTVMETQALTLHTSNGGVILFNDAIDGENVSHTINESEENISRDKTGYTIEITGDNPVDIESDSLKTPQYVKFNNSIFNAGEVSVTDSTLVFGQGPYGKGQFVSDDRVFTSLSLNNAAFDLFNRYQDTVTLAGYKATGSFLHIDVDVERMSADKLIVDGNVEGTTRLVLYPSSDKDITGAGSIVFAQSTNDTTGNDRSFEVFRVYGSPYMFDVNYTQTGSNENQWSLSMNDKQNPDSDKNPEPEEDPEIPNVSMYSEVAAYQGLHAAGIEQTRGLGKIIRAEADRNLWVNADYKTASVKAPVDTDADIWGLTAGADWQHNLNHRLGFFASYRQGEYDLSGKSDFFAAGGASEIDIDSYIGGLYYRHDYQSLRTFATLYGGLQKADIQTADGVKSDTDGVQLGASVETGWLFNLSDSLKLEPGLGIFYTQIDFDDVSDAYGKSAEYDTIRQTEIELGVKLEKYLAFDDSEARVYLKPSVVQVLTDGDKVAITGLNEISTYEDGTLGRLELGGRYVFTDKLFGYGFINYTFGDDYNATTFGLGLNYAF